MDNIVGLRPIQPNPTYEAKFMVINQQDNNFAIRAALKVFYESYSAAVSLEGAFERIYEKINDLYRGIKNRRGGFISTEAIIHATAIHRKISFDEAKIRHMQKTADEIARTRKQIKANERLWKIARSFDRTPKGGQQFVTQRQDGNKIVFLFKDNRELEFDLLHCSDNICSWLSSLAICSEVDGAIDIIPVIRKQISAITKWADALIEQALDNLTQEDREILYTKHHLSQFRTILVSEERKINKPINLISTQDVVEALQSLLDELEEAG